MNNLCSINCDLGEHESPAQTEQLMCSIDAANIACGGHAGDDDSMKRCIALAIEHHVMIGAHPGLEAGFGRSMEIPSTTECLHLIDQQIRRLVALLPDSALPLHHVKLHGALYHATDGCHELAESFVDYMKEHWPDTIIIARSAGLTAQCAQQKNAHLWQEMFLDRAYEDDGSLVDRQRPDACIEDADALRSRIRQWRLRGTITTRNGKEWHLPAQTCCLHGDGANACTFARVAREEFHGTILP